MLRFKYLIDNRDLVKMILSNWKYDEESVEEWLDNFRISENAVYSYPYKGQTYILRFAPVREKSSNQLFGTLEFLEYLHQHNMHVMRPVRSKRGNIIEHIITPWGEYYAASYQRVAGDRIDQMEYDAKMMYTYGQTLGELHRLSQNFTPNTVCKSHEDILRWIETVLYAYKAPAKAIEELYIVSHYLNHLTKHYDNYGLIHYDFQMDNLFYDAENECCSIIDFDDAMYHWYCMDIVNVLDDLQETYSKELYEKAKDTFLHGYQSIRTLPHSLYRHQKVFLRFANLYKYTRMFYAISEPEVNEPEWMKNLRHRFVIIMSSIEPVFGTQLED